jgi:hypothetical protein
VLKALGHDGWIRGVRKGESRWQWEEIDCGLSCFREREKVDNNVRLGMKDLDMVVEVHVDIKITNSCRLLFRSEALRRIQTSGCRLLFSLRQPKAAPSHSTLQPSSLISWIISLELIHLCLHAAIPAEKPYLTNTGQAPRCCMLMLHPECIFQIRSI